MADLAVGDTVIATWKTPTGTTKSVRGEVIELKNGRVHLRYCRDRSSRNTIDLAIREIWRPESQVRKVARKPGEPPVNECLTDLVYALAGKEPSDG